MHPWIPLSMALICCARDHSKLPSIIDREALSLKGPTHQWGYLLGSLWLIQGSHVLKPEISLKASFRSLTQGLLLSLHSHSSISSFGWLIAPSGGHKRKAHQRIEYGGTWPHDLEQGVSCTCVHAHADFCSALARWFVPWRAVVVWEEGSRLISQA